MSKTIFITGASSGIGKASVRRFAGLGWNVVASMRNPAAAADLAGLDQVLLTRLDVRDPASIQAALAAGIARFGSIDVLLNNAGFGQYGIFESTPPAKVREQFDVNVFGVMDVTRAFLPHFRQQQRGTIINVSSGAGLFTLPMISLYCASKFALEGFSEALSYELASQGITVKLVIPHGGVSSTRFSERSGEEFAELNRITDYDAFIERTNASFAAMTQARSMSSDDVAGVIVQAATDGSDQLRYLIGDDSRGFVKARRELSEPDYIAFMRAHFVGEQAKA
jgi:NAD(P)-dependent dehydrogenase (short-subunit alcohol dehydrogenase family)